MPGTLLKLGVQGIRLIRLFYLRYSVGEQLFSHSALVRCGFIFLWFALRQNNFYSCSPKKAYTFLGLLNSSVSKNSRNKSLLHLPLNISLG